MAITVIGGTTAAPAAAAYTLARIISRVREKLDDLLPTAAGRYLWSNETLTDDLNAAVNELCAKVKMIEDDTTAAICTHPLLANGYALALSPRLVGITRAELVSTGATLQIFDDVREMDNYSPGWKTAVASSPKFLIKGGLGNNVGRVWPATLLADTIHLTVQRLPLVDMSWTTDQALTPEIDEIYHDKLYIGVLAQAYDKADTDTEHKGRLAEFRTRWDEMIDQILGIHTYKANVFQTSIPHPGHM